MWKDFTPSRGEGLKNKHVFMIKMAKCEICNSKIETTFLGKIIGTIVKDKKGKKHAICFACQKINPDKEAVLSKLK
jgi:uncharacterized protein with PIN domain